MTHLLNLGGYWCKLSTAWWTGKIFMGVKKNLGLALAKHLDDLLVSHVHLRTGATLAAPRSFSA